MSVSSDDLPLSAPAPPPPKRRRRRQPPVGEEPPPCVLYGAKLAEAAAPVSPPVAYAGDVEDAPDAPAETGAAAAGADAEVDEDEACGHLNVRVGGTQAVLVSGCRVSALRARVATPSAPGRRASRRC